MEGIGVPGPPQGPRKFTYTPLDQSSDSLRLLILKPGHPDINEVRCCLGNATFASKPKYEALSYRWGDPNDMRVIVLNDCVFRVRRTLYLALHRLRHRTEERTLWIDAICINQDDIEERNWQVELMSFIYRRAFAVVVWLGDMDFPGDSIRLALLPNDYEILCKAPYWTRVWIVQEIGLASKLEVCYGYRRRPQSLPWGTFASALNNIDSDIARLPLKLAKQRHERHGDESRLERLVRAFVDAECQEPRDKIYGFLGLAHDCQGGTLKVDYSKRLFQLYEDVILFHARSKPLETGLLPNIDRPMRLVRFSQTLQALFKGAISGDAKLFFATNENTTPILTARGLIEGAIIHLGPSYTETVASSQAERQWKLKIEEMYGNSFIREIDEAYTYLLLAMEEEYLRQIQNIDTKNYSTTPHFSPHATPLDEDWEGRVLRKGATGTFDVWSQSAPTQSSEAYSTTKPHEPRRFLASNSLMGLAPSGAQEGDLICRFHECDVAVVLRRRGMEACFDLVGRADCATRWAKEDRRPRKIEHSSYFEGGGVVAVKLDIATLQLLTGLE